MSPKSRQTIGERVRKLREQKNWSQQQLAAMIPGVQQQSIDQLEQGAVARPRYLPELAQVLGCRLEWLLTGKGIASPARRSNMTEAIDPALLIDVVTVIGKALDEQGLHLDRESKAKLVGAVYELIASEEDASRERLEDIAGNVVSYEKLLRRRKP